MLITAQFRWTGHVTRMDAKCQRMPKELLYGELQEGTRTWRTETKIQGHI